jgi:chemotaxis protein methyltransferase CheR
VLSTHLVKKDKNREEFLSTQEYEDIRQLVKNTSGIVVLDKNARWLQKAIQKGIARCNFSSIQEYSSFLQENTPRAKRENCLLVDDITINETFFFRNPSHFEALKSTVVPEIVSSRRKEPQISSFTVWCAGCSTGQEAWSVAIVLAECAHLLQYFGRTTILATDISETAIAEAKRGIYPKIRLDKMDSKRMTRWFKTEGEQIHLRETLKAMVRFNVSNILTMTVPPSSVDIIFCRNVMIYFDRDTQKKLVDKFHACLRPGGVLFIGHSESLMGLTNSFKYKVLNDGIVYQKM